MRVNKVINTSAAVLLVCACLVGRAGDALDTWTAVNVGTQWPLRGVAYRNGQFVAVGLQGTILTSPDGVTWTPRSSGTSAGLGAVAFAADRFVAVGDGPADPSPPATILTSADGVSWARWEAAGATVLEGVAYGSGEFVTVGWLLSGSGVIFSSPNGTNWTQTVSSSTKGDIGGYSDVAYGNGIFSAIALSVPGGAANSGVAVSTNGIDWTINGGVGPLYASRVCFGNGVFVAVGAYLANDPVTRQRVPHAVVYSSVDGFWWTKRQEVIGEYDAVCYGAGLFVATGGPTLTSLGATITSTSPDGTNWTQRATSAGGGAIVYGGNQFVAAGPSGGLFRSGVIGKLGASLSPSGQFLGTIGGATGQRFAIQASPDLAGWSPLTNVTLSDGTSQFSDPITSAASRRFYKAVIPNQ